MEKVIIVRYSEIHLKGNNRGWFEKVLFVNMEKSLKGLRHEIRRQSGRYLIENFDSENTDIILNKLKKVFGIHSYSVGLKVNSDLNEIYNACLEVCGDEGTFKVDTHRADKKFPLTSMQLNAEIGGKLLNDNPKLKVDVHNPLFIINVDIRENGTALVFNEFFKGAGGMPVGTAGKGLLLISGGIDSPVAGHMIAKRGMSIECLHFHSYPHTNELAKEKVVSLAKRIAKFTNTYRLSTVSVTRV